MRNGFFRLGLLQHTLGKDEEAIATILKMLENYQTGESIGEGCLLLGRIYQKKKNYADARDYYGKAKQRLKISGIPQDLDFNYAICCTESGSYKEAIPILEKMDKDWWEDKVKDMDYRVQYYLGKCYEGEKNNEEALKWYKRYMGNTFRNAVFRDDCRRHKNK